MSAFEAGALLGIIITVGLEACKALIRLVRFIKSKRH